MSTCGKQIPDVHRACQTWACWETGYRCLNALLCWEMKCQGGGIHLRGSGEVWENTTSSAQPPASLHSTKRPQPCSPFCQNDNVELCHRLIMESVPPCFILGAARVQFLATLLRSFGSPLHITHPIFLFVAFSDINWVVFAYLYQLLFPSAFRYLLLSAASCSFTIFPSSPSAPQPAKAPSNLSYIKVKSGATQQPYPYDSEERRNI